MKENINYLDEEGYQEHLKSIINLENNLHRIEESMNALDRHNFDKNEYEELLNLKEGIINKINEKKSLRVVIVERKTDDNIIDIGDTIKVNTYFSDTDIFENIYELVAGESDFDKEIMSISINTPIGKALYGAKVGDIKYYDLKEQKVKVKIIEKVDTKKLTKTI